MIAERQRPATTSDSIRTAPGRPNVLAKAGCASFRPIFSSKTEHGPEQDQWKNSTTPNQVVAPLFRNYVQLLRRTAKGELSCPDLPAERSRILTTGLCGVYDYRTEIIAGKTGFFFRAITMHSQVGNVDFPMLGFGIFPESRQVNETWKFKCSCFHVFCFFFIRPHRGYQQQKDLSTDILVFEWSGNKDKKFQEASNNDFCPTEIFFLSRSTSPRLFSSFSYPVQQRQAKT